MSPRTKLTLLRSRPILTLLSAARRSLLPLSFLHLPTRSLRLRALRLPRRLSLASSLESELLEVLAPLELWEEGLRALFRLLIRRFKGLRSTSLPARSKVLELHFEEVRALLRFCVALQLQRRSFRRLRPLLCPL